MRCSSPGVAGRTAGALSMAAGQYVSVSFSVLLRDRESRRYFTSTSIAPREGLLDQPLAAITFLALEVVDRLMTSPAPIAALVQRGGLYGHDSV
jgi:hypothetical protein